MLTIVLGLTVLGLWLLLSGHYTPLLLSIGVAATLLVTWMARRMRIDDAEGVPLHLFPRVLWYWAWLVKEMFVANVQVARIVLSPTLPIAPRLFQVRASQRTDLGRVIYANSITLTPGTVTTGVEGGEFRVHALANPFAEEHRGESSMDERVRRLEGRKG